MYTNKSDLINRLVKISGNNKSCFTSKTVSELNILLEIYDSKEKRTYIDVPYKDKVIVKILGAIYDGDKKQWYVPVSVKIELFDKWKIK